MKKKIVALICAVLWAAAAAACAPEESKNKMFGEIPDAYHAGDTPVDFEVELLDGKLLKLSELKGKVVLLNFWFIDCKPCVAELPAFEKLAQEYEEDLVIIAVNSRDKGSDVKEFIEKNGYTFLVGIDPNGVIEFPSVGAPYTVILDRDGKIAYASSGGTEDWETMYHYYQPEIEKLI